MKLAGLRGVRIRRNKFLLPGYGALSFGSSDFPIICRVPQASFGPWDGVMANREKKQRKDSGAPL